MAEELRNIFSDFVRECLTQTDNHEKLEDLKEYYNWNPNETLEHRCKREFPSEIEKALNGLANKSVFTTP